MFPNFKCLITWVKLDLDILANGDRMYKSLNRSSYLSVKGLSMTCWIAVSHQLVSLQIH